jgi:cytochrome P450
MDNSLFTPPGVPPATEVLSVMEVARRARKNPLSIIPKIAYEQPIVTGKTVIRWHMVMDPGALKRVFLENVDNYPKSTVTLRLLKPAVGESLFTSEGKHWRWQRRATAPAFQHRNVMHLASMMTDSAEATCRRLEGVADGAGVTNIDDEMTTATFDVVCDALLSGRDALNRDELIDALARYLETVGRVSLLDVLGLPNWVPRPAQLFSRGSIRDTQKMMEGVIGKRRAKIASGEEASNDLLNLILEAEDPKSGRRMSDAEARDNLLTFVIAGHETTALTLGWALYLIAAHPPTQERLAAEVDSVLNGRAATGEDYDALPFTRQVIEETLRLYPPAAFLSRNAKASDTLVDREINAGDTVMLPIYTLHRNKLLWDQPDVFDPDNFTAKKVKDRDRFAYLPFGQGPRICIGMNFAMTEAAIILATVVSRFRFAVEEGFTPKPELTLTLRSSNGLRLKVERRHAR